MWLITTSIAALFVTALGFFSPKKYRLDLLSLMLWGAAVMIFIDHLLGYEGGEFLEMETGGLIPNGALLGVTMLIPIFTIWEVIVLISKRRGGPEWS
jgi:hypothetical protein